MTSLSLIHLPTLHSSFVMLVSFTQQPLVYISLPLVLHFTFAGRFHPSTVPLNNWLNYLLWFTLISLLFNSFPPFVSSLTPPPQSTPQHLSHQALTNSFVLSYFASYPLHSQN